MKKVREAKVLPPNWFFCALVPSFRRTQFVPSTQEKKQCKTPSFLLLPEVSPPIYFPFFPIRDTLRATTASFALHTLDSASLRTYYLSKQRNVR